MDLSFDLAPGSLVTSDTSSIVPLAVTVANNVFSQPTLASGTQETMATFNPTTNTTVVYYNWTYTVVLGDTGHAVNVIIVNDYTAMVDPPIASIPTAIALGFVDQQGTLAISQSVYIPSTQTWTLSFYGRPLSDRQHWWRGEWRLSAVHVGLCRLCGRQLPTHLPVHFGRPE